MTDAEWAHVRASMPVPARLEGRGGRPEEHCHREMIDAVRYVVDNGGKWRAIPADFPWWRAVYDFFRRWSRHDYVRELYQRLRRLEHKRQGRDAEEQLSNSVDLISVRRPPPHHSHRKVAGHRATARFTTTL